MQTIWTCKKFEELTVNELYKILTLRSEVFVVEQNCVYLDTDNKDAESYHLFRADENKVIAYARLMPVGLSYPEVSIGRVVTHAQQRNNGMGKLLMQQAIEQCFKIFNCNTIKIGAQLYLIKFYTNLGFVQVSDPYLEDGIAHIEMLLQH